MGSSYRSSVVENDMMSPRSSVRNLAVHLRSSVNVKATFVLNVEHQVASVQVLHHKEEVLLCKKTKKQKKGKTQTR